MGGGASPKNSFRLVRLKYHIGAEGAGDGCRWEAADGGAGSQVWEAANEAQRASRCSPVAGTEPQRERTAAWVYPATGPV